MTYTTTVTAVRGGLLAAAALLIATAAPAQAAPQDSAGSDWLVVTVTTGDAHYSKIRSTLLMCDPPEGHGRATEACAQLETADGDIGAVPTREVYCPMVYAPVTAHAHGLWHGRPVEYTETFSNTCELGARTGAVFALDG